MISDNNLVPSFFTISQAGGNCYVTLGFFDVMDGAILKPRISKWASNAKTVFSKPSLNNSITHAGLKTVENLFP